MTTQKTGHAEIDQQHAILEQMVDELHGFCPLQTPSGTMPCDGCAVPTQRHCTQTLTRLSTQLSAFLIGHATYEERMMELLPATETCQNHIHAHKAAHAGIARRLRVLANEVANALPAVAAHSLQGLVGNWLGDHAARFDDRLVKLGHANDSPEIDFDAELVAMLDLHVFPNRPTSAGRLEHPLYSKKLEMRGRFESLTAAQRKVYWLVIAGRKNTEIAAELAISINTVKSHRGAIFQKFEVTSVLELVKKSDALR